MLANLWKNLMLFGVINAADGGEIINIDIGDNVRIIITGYEDKVEEAIGHIFKACIKHKQRQKQEQKQLFLNQKLKLF